MSLSTLNFYNQQAEEFYNTTVNVDMSEIYKVFEAYLQPNSRLMDVGCGSGRDTLYFLSKGHACIGLDYSEELVKKAKALTQQTVLLKSFYDIEDVNYFDGIWCCASLLHCERDRLGDVLGRLERALKFDGVMYLSFKYGDGQRQKDGRVFLDLNEVLFQAEVEKIENLCVEQMWKTQDQRPERSEEWLNVILKKRK